MTISCYFSDLSELPGSLDAVHHLEMAFRDKPSSYIRTSYIIIAGNSAFLVKCKISPFFCRNDEKKILNSFWVGNVWKIMTERTILSGLVHRYLRSGNLSPKLIHSIPYTKNRSRDGFRWYVWRKLLFFIH